MFFLLPDSKAYLPGPGRCIYCPPGAPANSLLRREHIIAKKLGGTLVLHAACCDDCQALINKEIETPCLTRTWLAARTHLNMKTSTPRATLPMGTWDASIKGLPGNMAEANFSFEEVPITEHPFVILMLSFKPPGIMRGVAPQADFEAVKFGAYTPGRPRRFPKGIDRAYGEMQPVNPTAVGRMIAKIGHGAAVAELGLDAFTPLLPDIITGRSPCVPYLVGTSPFHHRKRRSSHRITLNLENGFIVANVQLFAQTGAPIYQAVVGRPVLAVFKDRIGALLRASKAAK